ncbi:MULTISPECIES: SusD/RagB family nutrient-binding outer membrane lipoprotein [unclassified Proteiniphilum]|jgi:hypothetical protein|uniref:SusD/RagB family nutrient-binding outer membrane lipoprotein n=1 Tax=unclassified Proteiniphilum TaxID=2622718 RepID=UPI0032E38030
MDGLPYSVDPRFFDIYALPCDDGHRYNTNTKSFDLVKVGETVPEGEKPTVVATVNVEYAVNGFNSGDWGDAGAANGVLNNYYKSAPSLQKKSGEAEKFFYKYPVASETFYGKNLNDQLSKIITQKYIAQLPWLPLEAWCDHRRLGLPFFDNVAVDNPLSRMSWLTKENVKNSQKYNFFPQRLRYPSSLENSNPEGYKQALQQLGGENGIFTPLWWSKGKNEK